MKRALILHGTDGNPNSNWFPWLKSVLETAGYEVWAPLLPNNHTPNRQIYNDFIFDSEWDLTDSLIIGHSSGAVEILNILDDVRCPKINTGILVGVWANNTGTDLDTAQYKSVFPETGFNFERIKNNISKLYFIHGDKDPYCPVDQAIWLAKQTASEITVIPEGLHLGEEITKFPQIIDFLEKQNLL